MDKSTKMGVTTTDYGDEMSLISSLCIGRVIDIDCGSGVLSDFYSGDYVGLCCDLEKYSETHSLRSSKAKFAAFDFSLLNQYNFSGYDTITFWSDSLERVSDFLASFHFIESLKPGTKIVLSIPSQASLSVAPADRFLTYGNIRRLLSEFGLVTFYDHKQIDTRIILTLDVHSKRENDLSLCMVVKNEEKGIEQAIRSCIGIVDNIVVFVDDSTSDKTAEIAGLYADKVEFFKWSDDFSAARNLAHKDIKTKWILFLDGHEFVKQADSLDKYLRVESAGLLCTVEMDDGSSFRNSRIYKNGNQFEGAYHERLKLDSVFAYPSFIIKHDRLNSQSQASIDARYRQTDDMVPRLLEKSYHDDPTNIRALFHLSSYYQSRSQFDLAIKYQNLYLSKSSHTQERWFILFNKSLCLMNQNKLFRALWAAQLCCKEMSGRWENSKLLGIIYFRMKRFSYALDHLVNTFEPNRFDTVYKPWQRDDSATFNLIGECLFNLKEYFKAHEAFSRASELAQVDQFKAIFQKRADIMLKLSEQSK